MAFKRENEVNQEQLSYFLKNAVQKVKTEEDVEVLTQLKKIFKKNVPLSLRGYMAAYLLKLASGQGRARFNSRYSRDFNKERRSSEYRKADSYSTETNVEEKRAPHPHVSIDPSVASTIFMSVGRNRRVYPRDLVGLLVNVAGLERDKIGDIRVLANYSFVQLFKEDADKAISALNNYDFRGRKLSVSYSKQKDYEDGEPIPQDVDSGYEASSNDIVSEKEDEKAYAEAEKASFNTGFSSSAPNYLI